MKKNDKIKDPKNLGDLLEVLMAKIEEIPEFSSLLGQDLCTGDGDGGGGGCS